MKLTATVEGVSAVTEGVWYVSAAMDQVLHVATVERPELPSILVVEDSDFDRTDGTLQFDFGSSELLILGARSKGTLILRAGSEERAVRSADRENGDELLLRVLRTMAPHAQQAG